jgi:DNA (cytosine-5)-methyltransferase 1
MTALTGAGRLTMRFGSICSGIEAASCAWEPLGWRCAFVSEIDHWSSLVLNYHYPEVPNLGDFTTIEKNEATEGISVLVGGTPCQAFSVAGLRKGFDDERGNLTLQFIRLIDTLRPEWFVWENVPGVLSQDGGRAFGAFLGGLASIGYGFAYRVLNAEHFGVPQRRRRVFVVGHIGDFRRAAAVLFERESMSGYPAPSREAGQGITCTPEGIAGTCSSKWHKGTGGPAGDEHYNLIVQPAVIDRAAFNQGDGAQFTPIIEESETMSSLVARGPHAIAFNWQNGGGYGEANDGLGITIEGTGPPQRCQTPAVAYGLDEEMNGREELMGTLMARREAGGFEGTVAHNMVVRRLTPTECERLQGFPDGWTKYARNIEGVYEQSDTQRYKQLGNSMAVPVMRWIGERIQLIHDTFPYQG